MNLGWLGAWLLALDLNKLQSENKLDNPSKIFPSTSYSTNFGAVITEVTRRARWNMKIGRESKLQWQATFYPSIAIPSTAERLALRFK